MDGAGDALTVATLLTLRQSLIGEIERPTTADIMNIDAAVVAYHNMLRVQGWIGNLSLVLEGELFGRAPLNEYHGEETARRIEEALNRMSETMLPLLERANRMMLRSLDALRR